VTTMDSPWIWYAIKGRLGRKMIKNSILGFCGYKSIKIVTLYSVRNKTRSAIKNWITKINQYGQIDAK